MHLAISPRHFDLVPGLTQPIAVTISNTGDVIGGYAVRVLGADPSWIEVEGGEISLFPGESRTVHVQVSVPAGMNAGERRLAVQVRELTPPHDSLVEDVVFTVPERPAVTVRADPMAVTAGRTARLSLVVANEGNTTLDGRLHGQDAEDRVRFAFTPPSVTLAPGEHAMVEVRASARRPLTGGPTIRPLELFVLDPAQSAALDAAAAPAAVVPAPDADPDADPEAARLQAKVQAKQAKQQRRRSARVGDDVPAHAQATFVQRALLSRGPISLVGLLAAITVFALVITIALSRIVTQSAQDRDLALEVAAANSSRQVTGSSGASGTVELLTSGAPVAGVEVSVFAADDTEAPLLTSATADDGTWSFGQLNAGDYKISFRGAGFVQLWYPQALEADDGETITLESGSRREGLDVTIGGVPASVSGTVTGLDVSNATLTLKRPLDLLGGAGGAAVPQTVGTPDGATPSAATAVQGATVASVPIGSDGTFELLDVPSPSVYDLIVEKPGYATSTQRIDVSAGEERTGVEITLRQGDGVITGQVVSGGQPLEGATVTASSGQTAVTTMTLTGDGAGTFAVRGLPTPASFTLVVTLEGYASQTLSASLGQGQSLTGLEVTLDRSSGSLQGSVALRDPAPLADAGGVIVTVTDGTQTIQTATDTAGVDGDDGADGGDGADGTQGRWRVTGLPVPGNYTITFSRDDLASQTVAVTVAGDGTVTGDGGVVDARGRVAVALSRSSATVAGVVRQRQGTGGATKPVGETVVQLVSNEATYSVVSASVPQQRRGEFRFDAVPPGTYTLETNRNGVTPVSRTVTVVAGTDQDELVLLLDEPAAVTGTVQGAGTGWVVQLSRSSEYPRVVYREVTTGPDGSFTFDDVDAPQSYVVTARRTAGGAVRASKTVTVRRSTTINVQLDAREQ